MALPVAIYQRFDAYQGNGQSALLQEVKGYLGATYGQTDMRADGQVVVVAFNSVTIEVVPVFDYDSASRWVMPDTNGGGRWKIVSPGAEVAALDGADGVSRGNVRPLIQMMKDWKDHCSVPLKSYLLEILVADFMRGYAHREQDFFYYDWFVRDFLWYLICRRNGFVVAPSTGAVVALGEEWYSRAETAYNRAVAACDLEREDYVALAGQEWRKVFSEKVPVVV
jgi:hypothetical protein